MKRYKSGTLIETSFEAHIWGEALTRTYKDGVTYVELTTRLINDEVEYHYDHLKLSTTRDRLSPEQRRVIVNVGGVLLSPERTQQGLRGFNIIINDGKRDGIFTPFVMQQALDIYNRIEIREMPPPAEVLMEPIIITSQSAAKV